MKAKKSKPKFNVLNLGVRKQVKERWRKPRGTHNKKRMKMAWAGASPRIGYRNPEAMRYLHPNGSREVLVHNMEELTAVKEGMAVRLAGALGERKRKMLIEKAGQLKLTLVNAGQKKSAPGKKTSK